MPLPETSKNRIARTPPQAPPNTLWTAAAFLGIPLAVYLIAAFVIAQEDAVPLREVVSFHADLTPLASFGRQVSAILMIAGAVGFLFVSPGLLGMLAVRQRTSVASTAHVWSLVVNSAALFVVMLVLRSTAGIERLSLIAGWWLWTVLLFFLAWQPQQFPQILKGIRQRWCRTVAIGGGCILFGTCVLFSEQFLQCLNEDGTEAYELARSLRGHMLPAWELETWELGLPSQVGTVVVNPALVNSYWTCGLLTLLGESEIAVRLPFWVWWSAIFIVCCRLIRPARWGDDTEESDDWLAAIPVGLLMLLVSVLFTFYVGYNPYMADIANPGVQNALFTLAVLCAFDCLRHRDVAGLSLAMLLASLMLYAGPVMLVLILAAAWTFQPIPRRELYKWAFIAFGALLMLAMIYGVVGIREGVFAAWIDMLDVEYISDYLAPVSRVHSGLLFAGYFVLGCGGISVLGMFVAWRGDAWQRTLAAATFGYLLIVLCSGYKNLHYLGPLLPMPLVLLLSSVQSFRRTFCVVIGCSILICLVFSWPVQRQTFVLNRQLGHRTTFATDDYLDAVQWGRLRFRLRDLGVLSWDCDQHTWVAYSQLAISPTNPRGLLVSTAPPIDSEYRLVATRQVEGLPVAAALFVRDPELIRWLSGQKPLRPEQRYPQVFQPLASGPYSPHNNQIEETRRLQ